ncbi:MAG: efflux RND transporter periplasmic adaptor subunit [Pseudomonadales bacterium]|nr:efflux RND transporter periplasmic adaptor subunit [Pseudomonadales bacterium]
MSTPQQEVMQALGLDDKRKSFNWMWIALIAVVGAGIYFLQRDTRVQPFEYVTQKPTRGKIRVTVTATGTLQPTKQVDIGSEVSGMIKKVFVDFNDKVTAGQAIAQLDVQTLEARLTSALASLQGAQASLAEARATLIEVEAKARRSRDLSERNFVSQQILETDEAALLRATASIAGNEAKVTSAKALLKESETALSKAVITSPIDGIIISRRVDPGQTMAASFQTPVMFTIAEDLTSMVLHLDIDESDIGQVQEGQIATFRVDAYPKTEFSAQIISVRFKPLKVNNIVTYETVLSVSNQELLLRPGMTATAEILIEETAEVLLVPNRSLRFLPPDEVVAQTATVEDHVWLLEDGRPKPLSVTIGLTDGQFTEIRSGSLPEDAVLVVDAVREVRSRPSGNGPFG